MGYRSEACFSITKELYSKHPGLIEHVKYCDSVNLSGNILYFHWDSIKWYDSYPEVEYITNLIDEFPEECGLVRLGEDYDDTEYLGTREHDVYLSRTIDIPGHDLDLKNFFAPHSIKFLKKF